MIEGIRNPRSIMNDKICVNILGTCISRDIFGMQLEDGGYKIGRFIQDVSPIAIGISNFFSFPYEEVEQIIGEEIMGGNFLKRNLILDFIGGAIECLSQTDSDYLLLDMGCCRYDLYKFSSGKVLTKMHNIQKKQLHFFDILAQNNFINEPFDLISDNSDIILLMDRYLPVFFEKIKELYPIKRIIFIETKISEFTVTSNGSIRQNPYMSILQNWKLRIEYANRLAKKYLVGCHWIEFPEWTLSDERHKWGPSALHYGEKYYDYAFSCINEIVKRSDIEKGQLKEEKKKVEIINKNLFVSALRKTMVDIKEKDTYEQTNQRLIKYCDYFNDLLMNKKKLDRAIFFMNKHKYNSYGIYGLSKVGIFWLEYLEKFGFKIEFVVENGVKTPYKGFIPVLNRNTRMFPNVDVIIVADILRPENAKEYIRRYTKCTVIDIYELIL